MKKHVMYVLTIVSMAVFSAVVLRAEGDLPSRRGERIGPVVSCGEGCVAVTCISNPTRFCWYYTSNGDLCIPLTEGNPTSGTPTTTDYLLATTIEYVSE
jgi:hypothetical protein